jgi:hypothetical protein
VNKVPKGCDQQGRYPEAAECCTEIGQEEEPNFYSKEYIVKEVISFVIGVVLVGLSIIMVAYLAGRFL